MDAVLCILYIYIYTHTYTCSVSLWVSRKALYKFNELLLLYINTFLKKAEPAYVLELCPYIISKFSNNVHTQTNPSVIPGNGQDVRSHITRITLSTPNICRNRNPVAHLLIWYYTWHSVSHVHMCIQVFSTQTILTGFMFPFHSFIHPRERCNPRLIVFPIHWSFLLTFTIGQIVCHCGVECNTLL